MKDARSRILYIGKAINLRSRVRSYFGKSNDGIKRSPEFMTHISEKTIFSSVGNFRLLTGTIDFFNEDHHDSPDQ